MGFKKTQVLPTNSKALFDTLISHTKSTKGEKIWYTKILIKNYAQMDG